MKISKQGIWVRLNNGEVIWKFQDPEDIKAFMNYGRIEDRIKTKEREIKDKKRYKTSDGKVFDKLSDAKKHEIKTYAIPNLKKDGYIIKE